MLPGTRQATARHSAPVSGTARCGCPIEIIRTRMSVSPAAARSPDKRATLGRRCQHRDFRHARNGAGRFGIAQRCPWRPTRRDGSLRAGRAARGSRSSSSGSSVALRPRSTARTNTHALAASIKLASIRADAGNVQRVRRVGRRQQPPGARRRRDGKSSRTGAPVPATPGIARSPSIAARPPVQRERARR